MSSHRSALCRQRLTSFVLLGAVSLGIACGVVGGGKRRVETVSSPKGDEDNSKSQSKKKKKKKKEVSDDADAQEAGDRSETSKEQKKSPPSSSPYPALGSQKNPTQAAPNGMIPVSAATVNNNQAVTQATAGNPFGSQNIDPKIVQGIANGNIDFNQLSQAQMAQIQAFINQNGGVGVPVQQGNISPGTSNRFPPQNTNTAGAKINTSGAVSRTVNEQYQIGNIQRSYADGSQEADDIEAAEGL